MILRPTVSFRLMALKLENACLPNMIDIVGSFTYCRCMPELSGDTNEYSIPTLKLEVGMRLEVMAVGKWVTNTDDTMPLSLRRMPPCRLRVLLASYHHEYCPAGCSHFGDSATARGS